MESRLDPSGPGWSTKETVSSGSGPPVERSEVTVGLVPEGQDQTQEELNIKVPSVLPVVGPTQSGPFSFTGVNF